MKFVSRRTTGLLSQFDEFGIELTPVEMKTTTERLGGAIRVAGENQLGSHTPRPRAVSDSLASVQVHETALTNAGGDAWT